MLPTKERFGRKRSRLRLHRGDRKRICPMQPGLKSGDRDLDEVQGRRFRGIQNLGATCYAGSVLQCLYHLREACLPSSWEEAFLDKPDDANFDNELQSKSDPLKLLFSQLGLSTRAATPWESSPTHLRGGFTVPPVDPSMVLAWASFRSRSSPPSLVTLPKSKPLALSIDSSLAYGAPFQSQEDAHEFLLHLLTKEPSLHASFSGTVLRSTRCLECENVEARTEDFSSLSVPIGTVRRKEAEDASYLSAPVRSVDRDETADTNSLPAPLESASTKKTEHSSSQSASGTNSCKQENERSGPLSGSDPLKPKAKKETQAKAHARPSVDTFAVDDALEDMFRPSVVLGASNKVFCTHCRLLSQARLTVDVHHWPKLLLLHLQLAPRAEPRQVAGIAMRKPSMAPGRPEITKSQITDDKALNLHKELTARISKIQGSVASTAISNDHIAADVGKQPDGASQLRRGRVDFKQADDDGLRPALWSLEASYERQFTPLSTSPTTKIQWRLVKPATKSDYHEMRDQNSIRLGATHRTTCRPTPSSTNFDLSSSCAQGADKISFERKSARVLLKSLNTLSWPQDSENEDRHTGSRSLVIRPCSISTNNFKKEEEVAVSRGKVYPHLCKVVSGGSNKGIARPSYLLRAVIFHLGSGFNSGHYTALVRTAPQKASLTNNKSPTSTCTSKCIHATCQGVGAEVSRLDQVSSLDNRAAWLQKPEEISSPNSSCPSLGLLGGCSSASNLVQDKATHKSKLKNDLESNSEWWFFDDENVQQWPVDKVHRVLCDNVDDENSVGSPYLLFYQKIDQ